MNFATPLIEPFVDLTTGRAQMLGMGLNDFCRQIGAVLATVPEYEAPARVADMLPALLAAPSLLDPDQRSLPPEGYGRHDVFICPSDRFSVIAAVWPAGIVSPIHDHLTWCAFGVYEGVMIESRYVPADSGARCTRAVRTGVFEHHAGSVGHLPVDAPDIHCMHNPTHRAAISIHVYGGNSKKLGPNLEKIYTAEA